MRQSLWDRRLGSRAERRSPVTRFGSGAATRRLHAPAQIEQARSAELSARSRLPAVALVLAGAFSFGFGGGASLAQAAVGWLAGGAPRVEVIGVRGAEQLSPEDVSAATGVRRATDLRRVDPEAVARQLAQHPWIASAHAAELPTGRLLVSVIERRAVASVGARGDASQRFAVDANGTPFAAIDEARAGELPRLVQSAPVALGETNPALAEAVALAGEVGAAGLPRPLEIEVAADDDPTGFALRLADFAPRIVLGRGAQGERLAKLASVLAAAPPQAAAAQTLDLRFADQVVLRGTPPPKGAADATEQRSGAAPSGHATSGGRGGPKQGG
jgi:cell division protein FtsQ